MATDLRGHTVPASTGHPARADLLNLGLSVRDPIPVANATAQATLLSDLSAAGITPSTTNPVFTFRSDTLNTEYTVGSGWVVAAFTPALCTLRKVTAQAVASGTATAITWDTEVDDALAMHTGTSATITIAVTGTYDIAGQVAVPPISTGLAYTTVVANGVSYTSPGPIAAFGASYGLNVPISALGVALSAGQTVSVNLVQTSGASVNVGAAGYDTRISVRRVS